MQHVIDYAKSFLGVPYKYASNCHLEGGIDCSGFVCELMRAAGELGKEDLSAQGLYDMLWNRATPQATGPGTILFFGKSVTSIEHVAFAVDLFTMIEAGGGDSTTTTTEAAASKNAFVRMRPISWRKDLVASLRPRYAGIGMTWGSRI
jgi:cell wall-associated NlpC family hydrolase